MAVDEEADCWPVAKKRLFAESGWIREEESPGVNPREFETDDSSFLGALTFYKRFVIACVVPEGRLEDRLSLEQLDELKQLSDENFEARLCSMLHKRVTPKEHKKQDATREQSLIFSCNIDAAGKRSFQVPFLENGRTPLQRAFGDDKVLQVKLSSRCSEKQLRSYLDEGIQVGLRHYEYYVRKEGKKRKNEAKVANKASQRCYFLCTSSKAPADSGEEIKCLDDCLNFIMHIRTVSTVALYNKRLQLALTTTTRADIDLSTVDIGQTDEIFCWDDATKSIVKDSNGKHLTHTDGTGFISEDLARKCVKTKDYPALIQVRLFYEGKAIKGTLLVLKTLSNTILYRDSMLKVKTDPTLCGCPTYNSLEFCRISQKPPAAKLSRYSISLLSLGKVPEEVFIQAATEAIEKTTMALHDWGAAYRLCRHFSDVLARRMLLAGIPLQDLFLQSRFSQMIKTQLEGIAKCKIPLEGSFYLMGTADPSCSLKRNQVAIVMETGPLRCSKVLVYRHPGMHPGDVHVFEATWTAELEKMVGLAKNVILFPSVGPRSVVDEMANGDLDGDLFWICTNEQVVSHFQPSRPWENPGEGKAADFQPVPSKLNPKALKKLRISRFVKTLSTPNFTVSTAATNWLVHMDRYMTRDFDERDDKSRTERCLGQLANLCYIALDSEKTGVNVTVEEHLKVNVRPHFQTNNAYRTYRSKSILGKVYDLVKLRITAIEEEEDRLSTGQNQALVYYNTFAYRNYEAHLKKWKHLYEMYRSEMHETLKRSNGSQRNSLVEEVYMKYRKELFGGMNWLDCQKNPITVFEEASAIYNAVYEHAVWCQSKGEKCLFSFVWNVAGEPLCDLYCEGEGGYFCVSAKVFDKL